ncbi:hypothetical protein TVAG_108120 [Trichomonas vaginalis G3]|uniref:Uncharacterized protein n=1 Tax=Trichomonas vaginalis (strain ATCC PRA-98 / G3) TaxID=412133 RepID=A2FS29_TRIV3|nr:hypothetical protein TVAGG3_0796090 [Trichomonas vaginalis G3]EAX92295.1 hypothetical protein TVAG_108120 [Trichomonas vaginalis G3]KAI5496179.1 hypothetical protein TVAGG3_0796090 [Trichomonas vaginalis G3]|eukprot:XP_001305225.1 hypothetical protein [Trichomonas vaginalis G3]
MDKNWDIFKDFKGLAKKQGNYLKFIGVLHEDTDNPKGFLIRKSGTILGLRDGKRRKKRDLSIHDATGPDPSDIELIDSEFDSFELDQLEIF